MPLPGFVAPTAERSANMRSIIGRGNRSTEARFRALLVRSGIDGWRLHRAGIPFSPDVVFEGKRIIIFVDGCFWHGCPRCGHIPRTNAKYWSAKIARNIRRDTRARHALNRAGYSVVRIRECELRNSPGRCVDRVRAKLGGRRNSTE
jgi:DNA mismatch endonuclease (patch repair protein)